MGWWWTKETPEETEEQETTEGPEVEHEPEQAEAEPRPERARKRKTVPMEVRLLSVQACGARFRSMTGVSLRLLLFTFWEWFRMRIPWGERTRDSRETTTSLSARFTVGRLESCLTSPAACASYPAVRVHGRLDTDPPPAHGPASAPSDDPWPGWHVGSRAFLVHFTIGGAVLPRVRSPSRRFRAWSGGRRAKQVLTAWNRCRPEE